MDEPNELFESNSKKVSYVQIVAEFCNFLFHFWAVPGMQVFMTILKV